MDYTKGYYQLALTFIRDPRAFARSLDAPALHDIVASTVYLTFGLALTTAFLLVNLNLIPADLAEPLRQQLNRERSLFSYLASVAVFALVAHGIFHFFLSGRAPWRSTVSALFRLFSVLIPMTTLLLVVLSRGFSPILGTLLFVVPPLGIRITDPFPLPDALPLAAGFLTIHLYVFFFFAASIVWTVSEIHTLSAARSSVGVALVLAAMAVLTVPMALLASLIYEILGPLVEIFLK